MKKMTIEEAYSIAVVDPPSYRSGYNRAVDEANKEIDRLTEQHDVQVTLLRHEIDTLKEEGGGNG